MYEKFNQPDTLGIISSYPARGGEVARGNAVSRYTYLLSKNFPKNQKIVVFCEIRKSKRPFFMSDNILIVPTYKINSLNFFTDVVGKIGKFDRISNILIEFEFSIFGGKIIIPQMLAILTAFKIAGKSTKIMFHQVVADINVLSGHLAITKHSIKANVLNGLLQIFYRSCGILSHKIFVHDNVLKERISKFIDESKVVVIPHAISNEGKIGKSFAVSSKKFFGVDEKTFLVGLFGYCSWYKGTDWLIENFARFAMENKKLNIRLLVAGGESPTLKGTKAYKIYHKKLKIVIKEANGNIVYTDYVQDKDVKKVFGATDLFVFPYRTKMSASGAFSLCLGYKKPYLVSKAFAENISSDESKGRIFSLNYGSFADLLNKKIRAKMSGSPSIQGRSWKNVAQMYLNENLPESQTLPRLNYAKAF